MSAALKPEDLLEPGNFPDDLKWVPAHYKLHPTDPVYLLIAWHWRRVKQSEDTLKATIVEIKKALDDRIGHLTEIAVHFVYKRERVPHARRRDLILRAQTQPEGEAHPRIMPHSELNHRAGRSAPPKFLS